mgnify:CR=1 FL=1
MPVVKVRKRYQLTIPAEVREKLGLKVGDYVEIATRGEKAVIVPKKLVDKKDAWYWSKEWQAKELEADEDIKAGRVKHFDDVEELIKDLNR